MIYNRISIDVPGQKTGPAAFYEYVLEPYSAAPGRKRPAVIVCPGGAYAFCSNREAEPVVMQFLSMGYHSFWLDYSVAPNRFPTALLETAKAVAEVRAHSDEWMVDPDQIYICGFSAGGHLVCSVGTFWNREFVYGALGLSPDQIRPNGLILGYPVITNGRYAHRGSFENLLGAGGEEMPVGEYFRAFGSPWDQMEAAGDGTMGTFASLEYQVTPSMPRTFLWHTFEDQGVPVENSLFLAEALSREGVNTELHVFPKGGHGLSLANAETSAPNSGQEIAAVQKWIPLVHTWIEGWR